MKKVLKNTVENLFHNTPYLKQIFFDVRKIGLYKTWVPLGHFYSPILSLTEIKAKENEIFGKQLTKKISGINLNEEAQLELFEEFSKY